MRHFAPLRQDGFGREYRVRKHPCIHDSSTHTQQENDKKCCRGKKKRKRSFMELNTGRQSCPSVDEDIVQDDNNNNKSISNSVQHEDTKIIVQKIQQYSRRHVHPVEVLMKDVSVLPYFSEVRGIRSASQTLYKDNNNSVVRERGDAAPGCLFTVHQSIFAPPATMKWCTQIKDKIL